MNNQHGIRAPSSEGGRITGMGILLTNSNYGAWSIKMKAMLLVNRVWDLVTGTRVRPNPAPKAVVVFGQAHANRAEITAANRELTAFEDACMRASCLIAAAISDSEILAVSDVIDNPTEKWAALSRKCARKSKMEKEAAHMALLQFEHIETESANDTISRFEALVQKCRQQEVTTDNELLERMFLSKPNERYTFIKNNYMHSAVQQNLQQIYSSLRDLDSDFQKREKMPSAGSAAFAEAVRVEVERQTAATGEVINGSITLAELLRRPGFHYPSLTKFELGNNHLKLAEQEGAEIEIKYAGYLNRQQHQIDQVSKQSNRKLPSNINYHSIETLSKESREKLTQIQPATIGQATRIGGVNPADINALLIWLEVRNRQPTAHAS